MSNISQKQRLIQNYTILGLECLCIVLSFTLAVLTRGLEASYLSFSKTYITMLACILFFHLLSYYLFDCNTNIFRRGYYVELVAVLKYNIVLILFLSFFLFLPNCLPLQINAKKRSLLFLHGSMILPLIMKRRFSRPLIAIRSLPLI